MSVEKQNHKDTLRPRFVLKKSNQLTNNDRQQWLDLYSRVFGKTKSKEQFHKKYLWTPCGYSYHGLMIVDKQIMGAYNAIPYLYRYFNREAMFALSVDTMVDSRCRGGPFNVKRMADFVFEAMKLDGICFVFGCPNPNLYDYLKRVLKFKDIGTLNRYVLVRNIGAIVPSMKFSNPLSRLWARALLSFNWPKHVTDDTCLVEKVGGRDFEKHRYDDRHRVIDLGGNSKCFYYLDKHEKNTYNLRIMDVYPLTPYFVKKAIRKLYCAYSKNLDMIVYTGILPFRPLNMIKISNSAKLQTIKMCGMILDPHVIDDRIFSINNWNVNASNYD